MKGNLSLRALVTSGVAIMISSITIGALIYNIAANTIVANVSESLAEIAHLGSTAVENNLKGSLEVMEAIAARKTIKDPNVSIEDKVVVLKDEVKRIGLSRISISDMDGNSLTTDGIKLFIGDRDYFMRAKKGQKNISDPMTSRADGEQIVTYAVPIKNEDKVIGVLYSTIEVESLSKVTDGIKYGEYGISYIVDNEGTIIAHHDRKVVEDGTNPIIDEENFDESYNNFFVSMLESDNGAGYYILNKEKKFAAYSKIQDTSWYFVISAPESQVFDKMNQIIYFVLLLIIVSILIFWISQFYIRKLRNDLETEKSIASEKIYKLAYFDPLTELSNRNNLESYFNNNVSCKKNKAAMFYMDLDNFKFVNDTFGHAVGDKLLVQVGGSISAVIQDGLVARFGGDEFVVLMNEYEHIDEVCLLADKLLKSLQTGFQLENASINISTSIGIALYPDDGNSFIEILKSADTALYAAKDAGKRSHAFFNQNMNDNIVKRMKIESSMRKAMENNEFLLYFQPQYKIETKEIRGFEALLRWNSPTHGFISPVDFICVAENTGLIVPLGEWVMNKACDFANDIIKNGKKDIVISVNVSVMQLIQHDFVAMVARIIEDKKINPSCLELEITESMLLENIDFNIKKTKELRKLGIKISLDDFGTGYSSLTYLRQLPIDILKIDKSFIDSILANDGKPGLTGSIISLAHDLGLEVVAEGVEKEEQLRYLELYKCDMLQGYLFSKPLPMEAAIKLVI